MNTIINWVGALGVARQCVLVFGIVAAIVIGYTVFVSLMNSMYGEYEDDDYFDGYWEE